MNRKPQKKIKSFDQFLQMTKMKSIDWESQNRPNKNIQKIHKIGLFQKKILEENKYEQKEKIQKLTILQTKIKNYKNTRNHNIVFY